MPAIVTILALFAAAMLGHIATSGGQVYAIILFMSLAVSVFAFFSPKASIALLVFSMLLSPEISLGAISASRSLVIRYDDIFIVIIFLSWFARTAIFKHEPFITRTPVQTPVLVYTVLCIVSTAMGIMRGDLKWSIASLYVLKYIEYFLIFFMTVNIVKSEEDVKKFLFYGLVVFVIVTLYAYFYYYASGVTARATAPFEAPLGNPSESEPASLGGYYLITFGILLGLMSEAGGLLSLLALFLLVFAFPAFLFTFSRASYIGFAAMLPILFFITRKRRLFLLGFLGVGTAVFLLAPDIRHKVMDRITMTYSGVYATQTFETGGGQVRLEDSAAARVYSLKRTFSEKLPRHPFIGWGVTGVGLGDTQYAIVLGELGIFGAAVFCWMLFRLFRTATAVLASYRDPLTRAVAIGFIMALVGLLFQAVGVNTFIVVRIMEPFWFLAAMLSVLYNMAARKKDAAPPAERRASAL